jgi:type III secretory pathway component EscT
MMTGGDPGQRWLVALALGAARTVPLVWLVPALGGPRAGAGVRLGLGLLLAVLVLPVVAPAAASAAVATLGAAGWVLLAAREICVGLTVGLSAGVFFRAAEAAGQLADVLRGANLGEALSPASASGSPARSSPLGDLYLFLAVVLFLELGGLGHFANALGRSYDAVPVGALPSAGDVRATAVLVVAATAKLVESALGLAAPVVVALALADVALGIIARAAPQIPIYFAAMPAKALLGLGATLLGLGAVAAALAAGVRASAVVIERVLGVWRGL